MAQRARRTRRATRAGRRGISLPNKCFVSTGDHPLLLHKCLAPPNQCQGEAQTPDQPQGSFRNTGSGEPGHVDPLSWRVKGGLTHLTFHYQDWASRSDRLAD
jgi:hypothetical protein